MGPSEGIPPAFRKRPEPSYVGLTEAEVFEVARCAYHMAMALPAGGRERLAAWDRFDHAMGELAARALRHALRKVREHEENGDEVPRELSDVVRLGQDAEDRDGGR